MGTELKVGLSSTTIEPALSAFRDGIGTYTFELKQPLSRLGWQAEGWAFPPLRGASPRLQDSRYLPHSFGVYTLAQMVRLLGPAALDVDVFHCTDHHAFRTACPLVITLHDAVPLSHPQWVDGHFRRARNWVLKRAAQTGDAFIAVSEFAVRELTESFGIDAGKITVVPNGIGRPWFDPVPAEQAARVRGQYRLFERYFLFVGTFQPRKNLGTLLDAYLALPDTVRREFGLVLAGRNGWRSETVLARIKQAIAQGEQIRWLGPVQDESDLRSLYQQAAAFVFPSLHEGFGLPVLEAFASGTPVIASNVASLPEVAGDAAILVDPLSAGELAQAMLDITRNTELRASCIARGRARAQAYTWERTAALTAAVYRSVL